MSDIVERLRCAGSIKENYDMKVFFDAADEVERLRAELAKEQEDGKFLLNKCAKMEAERDALLVECETWFSYIDPYDEVNSEDKLLYEARRSAIGLRRFP